MLDDEDKIRPYWRKIYQKKIQDQDTSAQRGICLITGNNDAPIASTHLPKINGVPGTQSFGAAIVSFDKPAFASYGFDQSQNASSSIVAVSAYSTADPAYNCGRLLAVFDSLQRSAYGKSFEGGTIAERYYGSASTTPNTAFSLLWRLHQHHLKKLRQQGERGQRATAKIKDLITQISRRFRPVTPDSAPAFPRYFTLVEQGRFALGFYQQMAARKAAIEEYWKKKRAGEIKPEEMDGEIEFSEDE